MLRIVDVSQLAVARARLANGAQAISLFGLFLLIVSFVIALEGNPLHALLMASCGTLFLVASRQVRRASWAAALLCGLVFIALLVSRSLMLSPLEFMVFAAIGFFIVQGVRAAFKLGRAQESSDTKHKPSLFTRLSFPKRPTIVTGLILLAGAAGVSGIIVLVRRISVLSDLIPGLNELAQRGLGLQYLVDMIAFGLLALSAWSYRRAKQHLSASASELRARDTRPPILLLRSFSDDTIGIVQTYRLSVFHRLSHSFEEILTDQLWGYGPVIAIGRPGEAIPPLGAAREYVANEDWQARIEELSSSCSMLVVILGRTEGVLWEIQRIVASGLLAQTVLVFPPKGDDELRDRWNNISSELSVSASIPVETTLLLVPLEDAGPLCITGKRRRSRYYVEALDVATDALGQRHVV